MSNEHDARLKAQQPQQSEPIRMGCKRIISQSTMIGEVFSLLHFNSKTTAQFVHFQGLIINKNQFKCYIKPLNGFNSFSLLVAFTIEKQQPTNMEILI